MRARVGGSIGSNCSPFGRHQFPRDSGCYDASLIKNPSRLQHTESTTSDASDQASNYNTDNTNNLDSVVQQCSNEILARVKQAQLGKKDEHLSYHPNIPSSPLVHQVPNITNSPSVEKIPPPTLPRGGNPFHEAFVREPSRRSIRKANVATGEEICEADQKLTMVKYVVGGSSDMGCESGNTAIRINGAVGGGCLSEKSSDSGVSSSSLSSTNPRSHTLHDSPTRSFLTNNNIYRSNSPTKMEDSK